MNFPSTMGSNWQWRMRKDQYEKIDVQKYKTMAWMYRRQNKNPILPEEDEETKTEESIL